MNNQDIAIKIKVLKNKTIFVYLYPFNCQRSYLKINKKVGKKIFSNDPTLSNKWIKKAACRLYKGLKKWETTFKHNPNCSLVLAKKFFKHVVKLREEYNAINKKR